MEVGGTGVAVLVGVAELVGDDVEEGVAELVCVGVAVRVSAHPIVSALCAAWGGPLVSTSANPAGARHAREVFQVRRYFGDSLDFVLAGRVGAAARPTTIRDARSGQIVRD